MNGPKTRRILMTADAVGGVFSYSVDLIRNLLDLGIETELVVLGPQPTEDQMRRACESGARAVHLLPGKLEWMPEAWLDVESRGSRLLDIAGRADAELVHLNDYCSAALPFGVPAVVVGHSCVYSWFQAVRGCEPPREYSRYYREVRNALQAATSVTAPTAAMLSVLRRTYGWFRQAAPIANSTAPIPPRICLKKPLIMTAGRLWDQAKNVSALERAASHLPWPVVAAGPLQSPSGESVRFVQMQIVGDLPRAALMRLYAEAAVFALPARYEPFGLCVLEAAHAGCALLLSDIPTFRELWHDCAVFVPPDDDRSLRRELQRLIDDSDLRLRLGRAARRRALCFRPEAQAKAYAELYAKALDAKGCPTSVRLKEVCAS